MQHRLLQPTSLPHRPFDQRGAGKSTPSGELRENTSQHLVDDVEALRERLGIANWHLVFGGSWGSVLALMYAQTGPDAVGKMVLRGVHTCRKEEYAWSRGKHGAARIWPGEYDSFLAMLEEIERDDPIAGYCKLLTNETVSERRRLEAAREWNRWDLTLCSLEPEYEKLEDDEWRMQHARIESHFFSHGCWVEDGRLLKKENIEKIRNIPNKSLCFYFLVHLLIRVLKRRLSQVDMMLSRLPRRHGTCIVFGRRRGCFGSLLPGIRSR